MDAHIPKLLYLDWQLITRHYQQSLSVELLKDRCWAVSDWRCTWSRCWTNSLWFHCGMPLVNVTFSSASQSVKGNGWWTSGLVYLLMTTKTRSEERRAWISEKMQFWILQNDHGASLKSKHQVSTCLCFNLSIQIVAHPINDWEKIVWIYKWFALGVSTLGTQSLKAIAGLRKFCAGIYIGGMGIYSWHCSRCGCITVVDRECQFGHAEDSNLADIRPMFEYVVSITGMRHCR